jgi:hypothetical protein
MLHIRGTDNLFISKDLTGFADKMVEDGVCPRRVDLLLLGFAFAVTEQLSPAGDIHRHELVRAMMLEDETRLAVEAAAQWYAKELGIDGPRDERELLNLLCRTGIAGMRALRRRWEGRTKSQIQFDIMRLVEHSMVSRDDGSSSATL